MNEQSARGVLGAVLALFVASFLAGSVSAQPPEVSVAPKNAGPIGIAELQLLLDIGTQFQIFDFDAEEKFCLVIGYEHEVDGYGTSRGRHNEAACNLAGPQRLIVVMRPVGDKLRLQFGLHDRDTGVGVSRIVADLNIPRGTGNSISYGAQKSIRSDEATTLLSWQYGPNPPKPAQRHYVRVLVRLDKNDSGSGIQGYPKPNDFGESQQGVNKDIHWSQQGHPLAESTRTSTINRNGVNKDIHWRANKRANKEPIRTSTINRNW